MSIPKPHFIYFDLDDTLLDHRHAERMALADVQEVLSDAMGHIPIERVREVYHAHNVALWKQYAQGEIDKMTLRRRRFEQLLAGLGLDNIDPFELAEAYLKAYAQHWIFCEGAQKAFHALADAYPTGIITNGFTEIQHDKMAQISDVRDRVETLIISEEFGVMKPDIRLFNYAAEQAGHLPENLLYVGDSYNSDVVGGRRAGWSVAWYQRDSEMPKHEEGVLGFKGWEELVAALA